MWIRKLAARFSSGSSTLTTLTNCLKGFVKNLSGFFIGATLFYVCQVSLVWLNFGN
jgi:hypothetical protein